MLEKNPKKLTFSEIDAATLTQRYDATTVLTVLQELTHYTESKFDWNELVKKTTSGISNAREYQMLWRHLAYRYDLPENLDEEGVEPMDDDSDIDCELESFPSASAESTLEPSACVKVIIASRTLSESTPSSSTIEAPLAVNFPVCCSSRTPKEISLSSNLMEQTSIMFPVFVNRQTLPTVSSTDALETKGTVGGTMANKRKRKGWSEEEDNELRAAVQRWGEGNWATLAKGDHFSFKRTATQLSQRWSTLRKKDGSTNSSATNPVTTNTPVTPVTTNTQYTAEQLATRHSLNLALDMPFKKLTAPGMTDPGMSMGFTFMGTAPTLTGCEFSPDIHSWGWGGEVVSLPNPPLGWGSCIAPKPTPRSRNTTQVSTVRSSVPSQTQVSTVRSSVPPQTQVSTVHSSVPPQTQVSTVRSSVPPQTPVTTVRSSVPPQTPVTTVRSSVPPQTPVSTVRSSVPPQMQVSTVRSSIPTQTQVSTVCSSIPAQRPSQQACGSPAKPKLASENSVSKSNAIPARELKPAIIHSGAQTVSRSNAMPQLKVGQAKNVVHTVPAGSSLTKTSISAGLPSDQKVLSNVPAGSSLTKTTISAGLPSDQKEHVTSVKEEEKRVSDTGSAPKEVKEEEASTSTTQGKVDSNLDKVRLDLDKAKSMPNEKVLEHKAVSHNPGECEEQGSVKNSNCTPKKATENGNGNLNKESQVLNQDKKTASITGSSNHQNVNEKLVNLPKQGECRQGLEVP
ncbi:hypothetical protein TSUD_304380 [Trifolium subterraneum]|uniref:Uncharacterized protein n=1 Tax=Trifolium subterraneum TaxID=3900 RepID=A0A2Z6M0X2_TRISU|nr:hypothetical protein TSUD_304380 [Trifolium subterraneum]